LEDAVREQLILKQTLMDLEESTRKEFEEMKSYYEGEIQTYIEILNQDKDKEGGGHLNSTRSNIEGQLSDRPGPKKEEVEYTGEWSRTPKFEIIFPEECFLTPDLFIE
jgi:hypothetical protein